MDNGVFIGIDYVGTTATSLVFDPEDFFESSLVAAVGTMEKAGLSWIGVWSVGFENQSETSMAWSSETGLEIAPTLYWEDKRTGRICEELGAGGVNKLVREHTGVLLNPYFSAFKFRWLIDNIPGVASVSNQGMLRLGGTDAYVIDRLTHGDAHSTDAGATSRTALFAQDCQDSTIVKATYGTGAFIEINTGEMPVEPDGNLPVFIGWELAGLHQSPRHISLKGFPTLVVW